MIGVSNRETGRLGAVGGGGFLRDHFSTCSKHHTGVLKSMFITHLAQFLSAAGVGLNVMPHYSVFSKSIFPVIPPPPLPPLGINSQFSIVEFPKLNFVSCLMWCQHHVSPEIQVDFKA